MGLPSYTGGCQYSFDQQVDRQNIVLKIDSDDYPMKSDLHGLKCAIINNNGHRDLLCSDPRPLPRPPRPGLGADRVQYGACVDNGTPTLPLYDSVHMCTTFDREIVGARSKTTRPRQLPCVWAIRTRRREKRPEIGRALRVKRIRIYVACTFVVIRVITLQIIIGV